MSGEHDRPLFMMFDEWVIIGDKSGEVVWGAPDAVLKMAQQELANMKTKGVH